MQIDDEQLPLGSRGLSAEPVASVDPAPRPRAAVLEGESVDLQPVDPDSQCASLYALSHESKAGRKIWTYLPYGPFPDPEALRHRLAECAVSQDPLYFTIYDKDRACHTGMVSYLRINDLHRSIEIGHIWFAPVLQNSRQSTEALYIMMRHAFDDLGYRRLEWKCNALNDGSRRAARRLGFLFEGIFYRSMIVKGRNRDTAWYSIVEDEWPRLHRNFQTWLAGANFDANGRQRQSLSSLNRP